MNFPSWREWLHSAKSLIAALLAFYIALAIPLENPYWAMASVYVVVNPLSGATRSKALFRALGTALGASASVFFLPLFSQQPELLALVTGLWVCALLFLSLLDRSPRSYIFMLAAYTVPLIMFSQIDRPETIFWVALSRTEEIVLGIVCASVVNSVLLPGKVGAVVGRKMSQLMRDGAQWAEQMLSGQLPAPARQQALSALLNDVLLLDGLILQMSYDSHQRDATRHAREFRARMAMLLPELIGLAEPLQALRQIPDGVPVQLAALVQRLQRWLQGQTDDSAVDLRQACCEVELQLMRATIDTRQLLLNNCVDHCFELIDLWDDCRQLQQRFLDGVPQRDAALRYRVQQMVGRPQHYDFALLAFSAASVGLSVACITLLWVWSDWPNAYTGIFLTAVVGCFFAGQDDPAPFIKDFLLWSTVSCAFSGLYLFVLLPNVRDFGSLAIALALPLLLIGSVGSRPKFAATVLLLSVQSISNLMIGESYRADFEMYADVSVATVLGLAFALVWARISKPFGLHWSALRLSRSGWRDLASLAQSLRLDQRDVIASRMIDRAAQLLPRLGRLSDAPLALADISRDLRVCFLLLALKQQENAAALQPILQALNHYYRACAAAARQLPSPSDLQALLEAALAKPLSDSADQQTAASLMGLYLALYPDAWHRAGAAQEGER